MELRGLTTKQALELQKQYGKNELPVSKGRILRLLKSNFINPLSLLLVIVCAVTFFLDDGVSATLIFFLVLANGMLGFYQEYKSEAAGEKLKKQISFLARVQRDGSWRELDVVELVPGDLVRLELANRIPADIEMVETQELLIDESSATGESFPVEKNGGARVLMGTFVKSGTGFGIVRKTGSATMMGKTATLLAATQEDSSFEANIRQMSQTLIKIILVSALFVFIINVITGKSIVISLLFAVALAVGLVPEALPTIITITLSQGALAMAKRGVIVKRLSAIEDLGNIDTLCTDKTGTLTENLIKVQGAQDKKGVPSRNVLELAIQCTRNHHADPIDDALRTQAQAEKIACSQPISSAEFDFERRRMSVLLHSGMMVTKGAPEHILEVCNLSEAQKKQLLETYKKLSGEGLRAIAVATKTPRKPGITKADEKNLEFQGFVTFLDPPKKSVKETLKSAQSFGIAVKVITGDNADIALHIANQAGIACTREQIMTGDDFERIATLPIAQVKPKLHGTFIFARANPLQKHLIIKKFRECGHIVGYMGDGVNDAAAIREADVGISVNKGADITKEAADIILLKKSLDATVQGIIGGRKVFGNVVKYIINTLAGNFGNLFTVGVASVIIPFVPLAPLQLLFANFVTDAPMVAVATDNVEDDELIRPKKWDIMGIVRIGALFGFISTLFDILAIIYFIQFDKGVFQTALFLEIILTEVIVIVSLRSFKPFYKAETLGKPLFVSILAVMVGSVALVYSPFAAYFGFVALPLIDLGVLGIIVLGYLLVTEGMKLVYQRMFMAQAVVDEEALARLRKKIVLELH